MSGNVALLPVACLNFVYTQIFHPALTSPRSTSPLKAFTGKADRDGPLPPPLSLYSLFFSFYLFFRKDISIYIARAHDIHKARQQATRQHFRSFRTQGKKWDAYIFQAGNRQQCNIFAFRLLSHHLAKE